MFLVHPTLTQDDLAKTRDGLKVATQLQIHQSHPHHWLLKMTGSKR